MQAGQLISVRTNPATQFIGGLAQNAAATLNMAMAEGTEDAGLGYLDAGLAALPTVQARLRSIVIQSRQNLDWEVWLWHTDAFNASPTDPALNAPCGFYSFTAASAKQIAAAGLYLYYVSGLDLFYEDLDRTSELHLMLVNRNAVAKSADAAGAIGLQLNFEPTKGW